jgi:aryl-alcohol dehydrogenase-like predicted oxidoreductase
MKYRNLGSTGRSVSEIGFGAWAIGGSWGQQSDDDSVAALHRGLDLGVNFIDTAAGYGKGKSERLIARVLAERSDRDRITVATKTPPSPGPWPPSPYCRADDRFGDAYLRANVEERLTNLGTDCLDLLQLHTWTRAWNSDPTPLAVLRRLQAQGKIRHIGISTPEHDQNSVIELMRTGWVDTVQVIYNIFEQEPAAQLLPIAAECGVGVIVRLAFDEGALTGKFTPQTRFADGDFRNNYFAGDRLQRAAQRADKIKADLADTDYSMPQAALKFVLAHPAVSTVIPGMRSPAQADANCAASDLPDLRTALLDKLHTHHWHRAFWYEGK